MSENLALRARAAGNDGDALSDLLNAEKYAPQDTRLLYDTGVLEDSMRLYWDADATVSRLQALPGGDQPAVLYLAARIKMDMGQLAAAVERMRAYLKARPENASAHYGLGRMLQLQENFAEAKAQFQQSLTLAPHQTESQFQLGRDRARAGTITCRPSPSMRRHWRATRSMPAPLPGPASRASTSSSMPGRKPGCGRRSPPTPSMSRLITTWV